MVYTNFHGEQIYGHFVDADLRAYFPDYTYKGVFLDIGAFEPILISNSHHFYMNGWDVHEFEANPDLIPKLKQYRKNVYNYAISDTDKDEIEFNVVKSGPTNWTAGFSAIELNEDYNRIFPWANKTITKVKVPQKTILTTEAPHITKVDIVSLDIEGGELKCLYGFDLNKYKPTVFLIENVTNDKAISEYLFKYGYKLDKQVHHNQFYLRI